MLNVVVFLLYVIRTSANTELKYLEEHKLPGTAQVNFRVRVRVNV